MSNEIGAFCNGEGIEVIKSPVIDHRLTRCVDRTIGSLKNSLLTFVHEKHPEPLEKMIERALGALRFSENTKPNLAIRGATRSRSKHCPKKSYKKKTISPKFGLVASNKNKKCLLR